jgi:hypothetical protein
LASESDWNCVIHYFLFFSLISIKKKRTKWKRQTAVGLELLAEAGNYATLQRLYAGSAAAAAAAAAASSPYAPWGYPAGPHLNALPSSEYPITK